MVKEGLSQLLVPNDSIAKAFAEYAEALNVSKEVFSIKINTDGVLKISEDRVLRMTAVLKEIEDLRKQLVQPYHETKTAYDNYAKMLTEPIKQANDFLKNQIKTYKEELVRKEFMEQQKKLEEQKLAIEKAESDMKRLNDIRNNVRCRLYGGAYVDRNGNQKKFDGASNILQVETIIATIKANFPSPEEFSDYESQAQELLDDCIKKAESLKTIIQQMSSPSKDIADLGLQSFNNARNEAELECKVTEHEIEVTVKQEEKRAEIKAEAAIKNAGKGLRKTVKYRVTDIGLVPKEYLVVDTTRMSYYQNEKLANIKSLLDAQDRGEEILQPISGIEFYYDKTYVSR
jgi:hypothetical protein